MADEAKKRNNVTIRMRSALKSRMEERAARHERSLSEEIETCIARALDEEDNFGGPEILAIGRAVAAALLRGGERASKLKFGEVRPAGEWLRDPWCYGQAAQAVGRVLGELCPPGKAEPPPLPDLAHVEDEERRAVSESVLRYFRDRTGAHEGTAVLAEADLLKKDEDNG